MNDPINDLLNAKAGDSYFDKKPSPDSFIEFDEPFPPEGSATLPPKGLRDIIAKLSRREPDLSNPPEPVYALNGQCFATEGNFTVFSALSKAGKSAVTGAIIASTLPGTGDTLGFSSGNSAKKALICIDTEQSDYHHDKKLTAALKRKGFGLHGDYETPDWVAPYALAGETLDVKHLEAIMWMESAKCGGIHSVLLDGVADLIRNVNDPEESAAVTKYLMRLAKEYKCHIIAIIHINPGGADSGKTRGHLGSELERRAETSLTIKVTERDRVVYARNARDCNIPESKGTRFVWSEDDMAFMTSDGSPSGDGIGPLDILEYLLGGVGCEAGKKCLKKSFSDQYGVSDRTVDRHITTAKNDKFIEESGKKTDLRLKLTGAGREYLKKTGRLDNPPEESA